MAFLQCDRWLFFPVMRRHGRWVLVTTEVPGGSCDWDAAFQHGLTGVPVPVIPSDPGTVRADVFYEAVRRVRAEERDRQLTSPLDQVAWARETASGLIVDADWLQDYIQDLRRYRADIINRVGQPRRYGWPTWVKGLAWLVLGLLAVRLIGPTLLG